MRLLVNTDCMKNSVKNIEDYLSLMRASIIKISNQVDDFNIIWKDETYKNFSNKMSSFCEELKKLEQSIETYSDFISGYNKAISSLDSSYKDRKIILN